MEVKLCIIFAACVCGYPYQSGHSRKRDLSVISNAKIVDEDFHHQGLIRRIRQENKELTTKPSDAEEISNDVIEVVVTPRGSITSTASSNDVEVTSMSSLTTTISGTAAKQENAPGLGDEEENPDEEGGGGIGGILTSFLGSLSTPEGGVDLDAVTGLLGGLSTQKDDGTYDFTGLQDTVGSLFGGDEEGGSNVGLFLGGLLGAIIKGSAGDQGAKGAGRLTGNLITGILPGLSAFPTPPEGPDGEPGTPQEGLNPGGFIGGLLKSLLGGLGGSSNSNSSGSSDGMMQGGPSKIMQFKVKLFQSLFSGITHVLGGSSG